MRLIVVGVDGSPASTEATRQALELAAVSGSTVVFVAAFSRDEPRAKQAADAARDAAETAGVSAECEVLKGNAASEILHVAESREADLIVVGSRGLGALSTSFLGGVSRWLLSHAHAPVLVVKEKPARPAGSSRPRSRSTRRQTPPA
jgi:nucleotide-binding universal stress UspA family protein